MEARDYMDLLELQLRIKEGRGGQGLPGEVLGKGGNQFLESPFQRTLLPEPEPKQGRKTHSGIPRYDLELALPPR